MNGSSFRTLTNRTYNEMPFFKRSPILRKRGLTEEREVYWKGCFHTYAALMESSTEDRSVNESPLSRLRDAKTPLPWLNVLLLAEKRQRGVLPATTKKAQCFSIQIRLMQKNVRKKTQSAAALLNHAPVSHSNVFPIWACLDVVKGSSAWYPSYDT